MSPAKHQHKMWGKEQTNREREREQRGKRRSRRDGWAFIQVKRISGLCAIVAQLAHKCTSCPRLDCPGPSLFVLPGSGPFRRWCQSGRVISIRQRATPCKWDTSGFSVKHLTLAFYGHSSTRRAMKCSGRQRGNNCSCKPWQVANKAVRDSASPVFTFAPQFVIIEKHSPKSVAYFSVPQTIYLIYAFCFANLNWHRVGNTTKVLSTSRELATGCGQMRKQLSMH